LVAPPLSADLLERLDREKAWEGTQLGLQVLRNEAKRIDDAVRTVRRDLEALQTFQADCIRALDRQATQLAALEKLSEGLRSGASDGGKGGD
jgi:DNA repair exonuclease SbcCD ATPase subunit